MAQEEDKTRENMLDYVESVHAIEQSILRQLDSMIASTEDQEIIEVIRHKEILIASPGALRDSLKGAELRPYTIISSSREEGLRIALA